MGGFKTFSFNGVSLIELGAVMAERPTHVIAERDIEFESVPYLNGDILTDNGRYVNKTRKIKIRAVPKLCKMSLEQWSRRLTEWLITIDYGVYRDDFNPGYFRKGIVTKIDEIKAVQKDVYETSIEFNFQPFWYSDIGQEEKEWNTTENSLTVNLYNPEMWESAPYYEITVAGLYQLSVNDEIMTIDNPFRTFIDKEIENIYDVDGASINNRVSGLKISGLKPKENVITITRTSGTGRWWFTLIPRWRRL